MVSSFGHAIVGKLRGIAETPWTAANSVLVIVADVFR